MNTTQVKKLNFLQNSRGLSTHRVPSWFFSAAEPMKPNQQTQHYRFTHVYGRVFEVAESRLLNNKIKKTNKFLRPCHRYHSDKGFDGTFV